MFSVKRNREEFRKLLTNDVEYIVDTYVRFPIKGLYVCLNEGMLSTMYLRLLSLLDNQDRKYNEGGTEMLKSMDDAKVAWYHTMEEVYTIIHSIKSADVILGVMDRFAFESNYNLTWSEMDN